MGQKGYVERQLEGLPLFFILECLGSFSGPPYTMYP
jgi:hypothetical protein